MVLWAALASVAQAQSFAIRADVSGGVDSNPEFALDPGSRLMGGGPAVTTLSASGLVRGDLAASVLSTSGPRRLGVELLGLGTYLTIGEGSGLGALRASASREGDRFDLGGSLDVERYGATFSEDDATAVGVVGAAGWRSDAFRLGGELTLRGRFYDANQRDLVFGGALVATLAELRWSVSIRLDLDRRESNATQAERLEFAPQISARILMGRAELTAEYQAYLRLSDESARRGHEHALQVAIAVRIRGAFLVFADLLGGLARPLGDAAEAPIFERFQGRIGLRAEWGRTRTPPPPEVISHALPEADRVFLVGSFTDWRAVPMERRGDVFRLPVALPPGRHRYHLLVDGERRVPEGVPTETDDFGGEDVVLVVE